MPDVNLSAGVDTSGVAAGMASIENTVQRAGDSIASRLQSSLSAGVIVAGLQKILDFAETIHRESARFGIDAEQLQVVTNAAKELGLDIGTVARAMNLLEINAQKALDPATKQALAMEHLGISAKAFAALKVDQQFFTLADAYARSAQDGAAYADVAELIGKRNTEMIPLLAKGSQAIKDQGKAVGIMSDDTVQYLAYTQEQWKTFSNQVVVLIGTMLKKGQEFEDMMERIAQRAHDTLFGFAKNAFVGGGGSFGGKGAGSSWASPAGAAGDVPTGGADILAGGLGGGSGGGRSGITITADLAGLNNAEKLNDLLQKREELVTKINSTEEQGDEHAASRYQLEKKLAVVDQDIATIQQIVYLQELQGVQAAAEKLEKSQDRVELDRLDLQIHDALNRGDEYGAFVLQNQANVRRINLDFNEKINKALDDANAALDKGLLQTARQNRLVAEQLESERQITLALEQQREERERELISRGPNPLTVNALAQDNLRLGATGDVYAAAVAASRGIKPGTPEYERLVQQISAQDQLRQLQGKNLTFTDQLDRDKLVQWFTKMQQNQATAAASKSQADEIAFWGAIAAGQPVPTGNPFTQVFGTSPFTSANVIPGQGNNTAITQLSTQIDLLGQAVTSLQQIQKNTTLVNI